MGTGQTYQGENERGQAPGRRDARGDTNQLEQLVQPAQQSALRARKPGFNGRRGACRATEGRTKCTS